VGVGEAPNYFTFIFLFHTYTTTPIIYLEQQQTRKRLVGTPH